MRINLITHELSFSGGIMQLSIIANKLKELNYEVKIISVGHKDERLNIQVPIIYVPIPEKVKKILKIYKILSLKFKSKSNYFVVEEGIAKKLGFHADIIRGLSETIPEADSHIATTMQSALALWLSGRGGINYYLVNEFHAAVAEYHGNYGLRLFDLVLRLPFIFLTYSSFQKDIVTSIQSNAKVEIIGVGIDTKIFYPRSKEKIFNNDNPTILFFIRGAKYKGDHIAIEALNIVNKKIRINAIMIGSKNNLNNLLVKGFIPKFNYILEQSSGEKLAQLLSSSDAFIFTSSEEGFGVPPLEAMACGIPVVTTDCKGNRDYALNMHNCIVVPPEDPKALANAVITILTNEKLKEILIKNGFDTVKKYTVENFINRIHEVLQKYKKSP
jgi:glycosyltransferase involved in cell wall biosynthesis